MAHIGEAAGDVLDRCFREIRRYPRLTRDEERALSRRIRCGDLAAVNELVKPNLAFVAKIAREYRGCGVPFEDLWHEGSLGLMEAARRFDGERQTRFIAYGVWWIRKFIRDAVRRQSHVVRAPSNGGRHRDAGRRNTLLEISLDQFAGRESARPLSEVLPDPDADNAEEGMIRRQTGRHVDESVGRLPARERFVLERRFGLNGYAVTTLEGIGLELGLTRERVRQIESTARARLRRMLSRGGPVGPSARAP